MILLDASGLLSALDESQRHHDECASMLGAASPPLLLSPFVLAELDDLPMRRIGQSAQNAFLEEVARGAYQLEQFDAADVARAREIIDKYDDREIGLADASIVVLAERYAVSEVLRLDQRHFRAMRVGATQAVQAVARRPVGESGVRLPDGLPASLAASSSY